MGLSFKTLAVLVFAAVPIIAESHAVIFSNRCGHGKPTLILQNGEIITGDFYESDGPLIGATAFLHHGDCGPQGEDCTAVKMNLTDTGSNAGVSLAPPYGFSVPTGFRYYSCGNIGANCKTYDCADASRKPSDTNGQVACNESNASIYILFCDSFENKLFVNS